MMPVTTTMTTRQHTKKRHIDGCEKNERVGIDAGKKVDGDQPKAGASESAATDSSSSNKEPVVQQKKPKPLGRFNLWLWRHDYEKLMSWMKEKATEIRTVDVGAELWNQFEADEVTKVLEAISELPHLQNIQFSLRESLGTTSGGLSILILRQLLTKAKGLEKLVLKDIELKGSLEEWKSLATVFPSHPLLHLRLENYKFQDNGSRRCSLADIIPALGANQTLRILEIDSEEQCPNIVEEEEEVAPSLGGEDASGSSKNKEQQQVKELADVVSSVVDSQVVATTHKKSTDPSREAAAPTPPLPETFLSSLLGQTKSLQVLKLCGLSINDNHIAQLLKEFSAKTTTTTTEGVSCRSSCKSLQELLLWKTEITDVGAKDLSRILSLHCPSVKKVNLNDNPLVSQKGCQYIFDSLVVKSSSSSSTSNATHCISTTTSSSIGCCKIEELYLGCSRGEMDSQVRKSLLRLIQKNRTIQKLEIRFAWPLDDTVETLAKFEMDLRDAINQRCSPFLQYVRLYNDGVTVAAGATDQQDQHSKTVEQEGNKRRTDLLWATIWERPLPPTSSLSFSDEEEEEKEKSEEETKTDERVAKARKIS